MNRKRKRPFTLYSRLKSFKYAFSGLRTLLKYEHNSRIHLIISTIICILGFVLEISNLEWLAIIIFIAVVIGLEIVNSVIERLCNFISPEWNENIKDIKDLMAAAVLLASIAAVVCGLIIFLPRLCNLVF